MLKPQNRPELWWLSFISSLLISTENKFHKSQWQCYCTYGIACALAYSSVRKKFTRRQTAAISSIGRSVWPNLWISWLYQICTFYFQLNIRLERPRYNYGIRKSRDPSEVGFAKIYHQKKFTTFHKLAR